MKPTRSLPLRIAALLRKRTPSDDALLLPQTGELRSEITVEQSVEDVSMKIDQDESLFDGAYTNNEDYLLDELRWVDALLRAQVVRWKKALADHRPDKDWGTAAISPAEIERYLESRFDVTVSGTSQADELVGWWMSKAALRRENIDQRLAATPIDEDLRLWRLRRLYGLSDFESGVLLLCLLGEIDWRYRNWYSYLQDEALRTQPSVALMLQILQAHSADEGIAAFDSTGGLLHHQLITLKPNSNSSQLALNQVNCDPRILHFLLGGDLPDPTLAEVVYEAPDRVVWDLLLLDDDLKLALRQTAAWWSESGRAEGGAALIFEGAAGSGRLKAAGSLSIDADMSLLVVNVTAALAWSGGWKPCIDRCYREAELQRAVIYWEGCERLNDTGMEPNRAYFLNATRSFGGLTILATTDVLDAAGVLGNKPLLYFNFLMPDLDLRARIWTQYLLDERIDSVSPRKMASTFRLTEGQVHDAIIAARSFARRRDPHRLAITEEDLLQGSRQQAARRLSGLAWRIDPAPARTFADLCVPPGIRRQINELNRKIAYRREVLAKLGFEQKLQLGKGLIVLFSGASGTGKTMTSSLLAAANGVTLFKVDMSALVSKWVGETEKNLARLFHQAEYADAILLFDEADSLFGKRGEVKEAQDRWANMEVNYLLQRIEEYSGVVILTTNLRQNIDDAFLRRIQVVIDFPFPDETQRLQIWKQMFTDKIAPPDADQLRRLAERFNLTGGSIKNVVIDAAIAHYDGQEPLELTLRQLVGAIAREYQKLGRPITQSEFSPEFYNWVQRDLFAPIEETADEAQ